MTPRRPPASLLAVGTALAAVYVLTAAGFATPGLPLGLAGAATGLALAVALARARAPRWIAFACAFLGLQLATWTGGPLGSAGVAACGAWALALGADTSAESRAWAVAAGAILAVALGWLTGIADGGDAAGLAGGLVLGVGAGSALRPGRRARGRVEPAAPDRREQPPAARGREAVPAERAVAAPGDAPEAAARTSAGDAPVGLERTLRGLRSELRCGRAVVWSVAPEERLATARAAEGGPLPPVADVEGDPLLWSARERAALRADRPPRWAPEAAAAGIAYAGELDGLVSVLTLEFPDPESLPGLTALEHAGARVDAALRLEAAEDEAGQRVRHAAAVLDATRRIASRLNPGEIALELCGAAVSLVGEGAALASWNGEGGTILGSAGELGGPQPGDVLVAPESQMAIAARSGAPLRRARGGRGDGPPVARPGERWAAPWRDLVVFPLSESEGGPVGVLAVWAREAGGLREEGLRWLEGVSGVAAAQLRNAERYGELRAEAEFDELTGLLNRRAFDNRFAVESARYERYRRPLSLLLVDLDHFKDVNDRFGHEAGDRALAAVAREISATVRGADVAARVGGEEFGVLVPETRVREAAEVAERVRAGVARLDFRHAGATIPLRVSVGVSACPDCVEDAQELRSSADEALYAAKRGGRDRVAVASTPRIPEPEAG